MGKLERFVFGLVMLVSFMAGMLVQKSFGDEPPTQWFEITCTSYENGESTTFEQTLPEIGGKGMQLDFPPDILESLRQGFCIFGPYTEDEEAREILRATGFAEPSYTIPDQLQGTTTDQEKIK